MFYGEKKNSRNFSLTDQKKEGKKKRWKNGFLPKLRHSKDAEKIQVKKFENKKIASKLVLKSSFFLKIALFIFTRDKKKSSFFRSA